MIAKSPRHLPQSHRCLAEFEMRSSRNLPLAVRERLPTQATADRHISIRQQQTRWPTRNTYVPFDCLNIIAYSDADFLLRTPRLPPVRLPCEMDETLWTGHKGAWKIGYRLTWCLSRYSPQGQEIFPQVLLPRHRP